MIHALFTLLITIKGLGGSFNAVFNKLGASMLHGPIVGGSIGALMFSYFFRYKREPQSPFQLTKPWRLFLVFSFSAFLVAGIWVRVQSMQAIPIDEGRSDMLVTITSQIQDFLQGESPYKPYTTGSGRTLQRFYLPVLWLSYLPLYVLNLDIRYFNIFAQCVVLLLVFLCFLKKEAYSSYSVRTSALVFLFSVALFLFSKQKIADVLDIQTGPFWLFYGLVLWAEANGKEKISDFFIPLVLLCRHPALLLFLPFLLFLFLKDRKRFWRLSILCVVMAALFILSFMPNPWNIIEGITFYGSGLRELPLDITSRFYGLSSILQMTRTEWLQKPLQVSGLLVALWLVKKRNRLDTFETFALGGLAYGTFILFVSSTPPYIWAELIFLVYFLMNAPAMKDPKHVG